MDQLTFIRADGARALVDRPDARMIAEALWELGLLTGAATAAASIVGAINAGSQLRRPVQFTAREGEALLRATDGLVTWSPA